MCERARIVIILSIPQVCESECEGDWSLVAKGILICQKCLVLDKYSQFTCNAFEKNVSRVQIKIDIIRLLLNGFFATYHCHFIITGIKKISIGSQNRTSRTVPILVHYKLHIECLFVFCDLSPPSVAVTKLPISTCQSVWNKNHVPVLSSKLQI